MADKKRILKEFEWFQVQTKVRQIISQVLTPLEGRITSNSTAISVIQKKACEQQTTVEYLTKMVNNDPQIFEHGVFSTIDNKIKDSNLEIKQLQSKIEQMQSFMDGKMQLLDQRMKESGEALGSIQDLRDYLKGQIGSQSDKLVQSMSNIFTNFDQINQDILKLTAQLGVCQRASQTTLTTVNRIDEGVTGRVEGLQGRLGEIWQKMLGWREQQQVDMCEMSRVRKELQKVNNFQKYTKILEQRIRDQSQEINNLEYKVEVIQPMVALAQVSDYALHFLPPQLHGNVAIYFNNRYRKLAQDIINNEIDRQKLQKVKRQTIALLKLTHTRSTKTVFQLKQQHLRQQGIDLDSLPHDKRQELLQKTVLTQSFGQIGATFETEAKKKDIDGDMIAKEMSKEKDKWLAELKQKIVLQMKDSKAYVVQMDYLLRREIEVIQQSVNKNQKLCQDLDLTTQLQQNHLKQLQLVCQKEISVMKKDIVLFEGCLHIYNDILGAYHAIERQDEDDRNKIVMLGVKERHRDEMNDFRGKTGHQIRRDSHLYLNKECLSCSGNPNYYNQFFKMACLTYNSTPVHFNSQTYQRTELLEKMKKELDRMSQGLSPHSSIQDRNASKQLERSQKEISKYSSQIIKGPSKDTKIGSDGIMAHHFSVSQDMVSKTLKDRESPRIINSKQLAEEYLQKGRSRLWSRRESWVRGKSRKEGSLQRREQVLRASSLFRQLKKQNSECFE